MGLTQITWPNRPSPFRTPAIRIGDELVEPSLELRLRHLLLDYSLLSSRSLRFARKLFDKLRPRLALAVLAHSRHSATATQSLRSHSLRARRAAPRRANAEARVHVHVGAGPRASQSARSADRSLP
jgi:hypothetical protein